MTEMIDVSLVGALVAQIGDSGGAAPGGPAPAGPAGPGGGGAPSSNILTFLWPMLLAFLVLMIFTSFRGQKKQERQKREMLAALKKHDKVQTHAGIIGTVVEIKDDQVVLKVDDATNTRIRFAKAAVSQVLTSARGGSAGVEEQPAEADAARV
ncbi:MAG: preprotein translocase subunit YajC [Phycisphaerales bacterium JB039]